jgi:hypothetical protein
LVNFHTPRKQLYWANGKILLMPSRKPKFSGKKTRWEKRRIVRAFTRETKYKAQLAEPLTMAPVEERQLALKKGKMVFYDNDRAISLPLVLEKSFGIGSLQGVYKTRAGKSLHSGHLTPQKEILSSLFLKSGEIFKSP